MSITPANPQSSNIVQQIATRLAVTEQKLTQLTFNGDANPRINAVSDSVTAVVSDVNDLFEMFETIKSIIDDLKSSHADLKASHADLDNRIGQVESTHSQLTAVSLPPVPVDPPAPAISPLTAANIGQLPGVRSVRRATLVSK